MPPTNEEVIVCFVDETGALHDPKQRLFAVGVLIVRDVDGLTNRLHTVSLNPNARKRQQRLALQRQIAERDTRPSLHEFQLLLSKTRHHEYKFGDINTSNVRTAAKLRFSYDRAGDILDIGAVAPDSQQEPGELGDDVIARLNPTTGEVENLEVLFFSTLLLREDLFELPVTADLRLAT